MFQNDFKGNTKDFSDVTLPCDDKQYTAHKKWHTCKHCHKKIRIMVTLRHTIQFGDMHGNSVTNNFARLYT